MKEYLARVQRLKVTCVREDCPTVAFENPQCSVLTISLRDEQLGLINGNIEM